MTDVEKSPVADWATDFDHTSTEYAQNATAIWDDVRASGCPVAHTERFGGAWMPTTHEDVHAIAHDTEHFSSQGIIVTEWRPMMPAPIGYAPPITSDPPFHGKARKILLPAFSPKEITKWEATTRQTCRDLLDDLLATIGPDGIADAAVQYTQHIPVMIIAKLLGLPQEDGDIFRAFIHRIIEVPGDGVDDLEPEDTFDVYLSRVIAQHRAEPQDDLVSFLIDQELDGEPLSDSHIFGTIALLLIAGIDTTWSAIGASLWHLAQHPEDRQRLVAEPDLMPFAIEEFLRFYAPVTMARLVAKDIEIGGVTMHANDWTLLPFPAANRDPEFFEQADEFVIDRQKNRHSAFGLGIHRCLGSNLARMEMTVAIEEWIKRIPDFELADADPEATRWSSGQVRGPRKLPVRLLSTN